MLGRLEVLVPPNRARLLSVRERPVGLANWRGVEVFGSTVPVILKGGRLEAGVLFEVTANQAQLAEEAAVALHGQILTQRDGLRTAGFLKIGGPDFSLPEEDDSHVFHKTVSYSVLYEYQYRDVDGTASFITRIPVDVDPEEAGSPDRESLLLTGRVARWDREGAPPLVVRGRGAVPRLTLVAFLPDTPGAAVELLRTFDGASGPPAAAASLQDLASANHIRRSYASLADFLADFPPAVDTVELSDLDGNAATYELRTFTFGPELHLPRTADRFEITTSAGAWGGSDAVLYLRAEGA
ncbi:MAG: hypothetical protein ABUT39_08875 [Acidobacteriota bacterium]